MILGRIPLSVMLLTATCCVATTLAADATVFPVTLSLRPNHRLILYGQELTGELVFTFADGETRVNGLKVFPPPPPRQRSYTDEDLQRFYGNIPYVVRKRLELGTVRAAVEDFEERRRSMVASIRDAWQELRASLLERDDVPIDSLLAAYDTMSLRALQYLDPDVVGDLGQARRRSSISSTGLLSYYVQGWPDTMVVAIIGHTAHSPSQNASNPYSQENVGKRLRRLKQYFSSRNDTVVILSRNTERCLSGTSATAILQEITTLRADPTAGVQRLTSDQAYEILNPGWE